MNVMVFYTILHNVVQDQTVSMTAFLMYAFGCVFCTMLIFITPIYCSVKCVNEMRMTSTLVNEMLDFYEDEKLLKTIVIFSQKLLSRDRVISTIFFNIDWKLLFSVNLKIFALNYTFNINEL
jgi:hypothetical protein